MEYNKSTMYLNIVAIKKINFVLKNKFYIKCLRKIKKSKRIQKSYAVNCTF